MKLKTSVCCELEYITLSNLYNGSKQNLNKP